MDSRSRKLRRRILLFVLAVTGLFIGFCIWARHRPADRFDPSVPKEGQIRIVTWNVGYFTPLKIKSARDRDAKTIAEVLSQINAHIIVLQELGSLEQVQLIAEELGEEWIARSAATGHPGQHLGVLTVYSIVEAEIRKAGGKYMLGVRFEDVDGVEIFLVALHAPHPYRKGEENVEYLRYANAWAYNEAGRIRILAGDFNYHFSARKDTEAHTLYSEFQQAFSDSTASIGRTYYARLRIDHIFHAPKGLEVVENGSGIIDLPLHLARGIGWWDHRPIVVTID